MFAGLIFAIQVNRVFFDYKVLAEAVGPDSQAVLLGFIPTIKLGLILIPLGILSYYLLMIKTASNLHRLF